MKSLTDQLSCVRRELALRRNVYPKWVRDGRMTQTKAEDEIAGMEAIVETLEKLEGLQVVSEEMRQKAQEELPFT